MVDGEVDISGLVTALTLPGAGSSPTFRVLVETDNGPLDLVFIGYKKLPGFHIGRHLTARGYVSAGQRPVMYNPIYWLKAES